MFIELIDSGLEHVLGVDAGGFGIALIIYTCILKSFTYPLYETQLRSAARMRKVVPRIQKIQEKHQGDQEAINKEVTQLYSDEKINPLQGFATALVQAPVLISLYRSIVELSQ